MRPAVSVVLPFHGTAQEARDAVTALSSIDLLEGDEVLLVDNTPNGVLKEVETPARVVFASREQSSYHARNAGAEAARNDWLVLLDSDCRPHADLVDRYFAAAIADDVGAVVGEVAGVPDQDALVARYARSRGHLAQRVHFEHPFRPWGVTANLLVRRAAWADIGGFVEGVRSTGDAEFSWRLQDAGWQIAYRPEAVVEHEHRETVAALVRQAARYGAGRAWIRRRYPGSLPRATLLGELVRSLAGVAIWTVAGQAERGRFKALDGVYVTARWGASWLSNTPPGHRATAAVARAAVATTFPTAGDPDGAVAAVRALGPQPVVHAGARPVRIDRAAMHEIEIVYSEDDGAARRAAAAGWLLARAPLRTSGFARRRGLRRLSELAPTARRLLESGAGEVIAVGDADAEAAALAELAGLERAHG